MGRLYKFISLNLIIDFHSNSPEYISRMVLYRGSGGLHGSLFRFFNDDTRWYQKDQIEPILQVLCQDCLKCFQAKAAVLRSQAAKSLSIRVCCSQGLLLSSRIAVVKNCCCRELVLLSRICCCHREFLPSSIISVVKHIAGVISCCSRWYLLLSACLYEYLSLSFIGESNSIVWLHIE